KKKGIIELRKKLKQLRKELWEEIGKDKRHRAKPSKKEPGEESLSEEEVRAIFLFFNLCPEPDTRFDEWVFSEKTKPKGKKTKDNGGSRFSQKPSALGINQLIGQKMLDLNSCNDEKIVDAVNFLVGTLEIEELVGLCGSLFYQVKPEHRKKIIGSLASAGGREAVGIINGFIQRQLVDNDAPDYETFISLAEADFIFSVQLLLNYFIRIDNYDIQGKLYSALRYLASDSRILPLVKDKVDNLDSNHKLLPSFLTIIGETKSKD
ncbi:unnamed protein product, partial [marine sediment metagenome]